MPTHDPRPRHIIAEELCAIGRRAYQRGFCAANDGNFSVRIAPGRVLITPTGVSKGFMTPETMCVVDLEGTVVDAPAGATVTSERRVHLAAYRRRADLVAVIHTHAAHATAFCVARQPLPTDLHPEAVHFLGHVPMTPYLRPGTDALAAAVETALGADTRAVLMASHGPLTFGASLLEAWHRMEVLDHYCRTVILAQRLGAPVALSPAELAEI